MKALPFTKMVASGNDFVVVDNRSGRLKDATSFARRVCAPHTGIGADGVLLFEKSRKADFRMRIVNADGSEAEACGNGFRCIALFAKEKLKAGARFKFESGAGPIEARVSGKTVRVQLVPPTGIRLRAELTVQGRALRYAFINTGVPHVVIFAEGLDEIDVFGLGRAVRWHGDFKPRGTNVNFVEVAGEHELRVRTYERGVENETLACGTGSTASAVVSSLLGYTKPPVRVHTRGGEVLSVDFRAGNGRVDSVSLEGEARIVYEGRLFL